MPAVALQDSAAGGQADRRRPDTIEGRRVELVRKIQGRYGSAKDEVEKRVDSWVRNM
jgi:uncharacterized protein YjbJ (UPF0337 family)